MHLKKSYKNYLYHLITITVSTIVDSTLLKLLYKKAKLVTALGDSALECKNQCSRTIAYLHFTSVCNKVHDFGFTLYKLYSTRHSECLDTATNYA